MMDVEGWKLPESDVEMARLIRAWHPDPYQGVIMDRAMDHVRLLGEAPDVGLDARRRRFVDVGANVGLWSRTLWARFKRVEAFEPHPANCQCFVENCAAALNVKLHQVALGDVRAKLSIGGRTSNLGAWRIMTPTIPVEASVPVEVHRLDEQGLTDVDLLKLDVEGYELQVLLGAKETILAARPVIVLETQKGVSDRAYSVPYRESVRWLEALDYSIVRDFGSDVIMVP